MATGLALAPARAFFANAKSVVRGENLLCLAPIYWMLLDLIQGSFELEAVGKREVIQSFLAIGAFACSVWVGSMGRPWGLPRALKRAAGFEVRPRAWFGVAMLSFALGMLKFASGAGFNPATMISNLGKGRWYAAWQRGQFGGWDAFLDHMSYFGYLLPALTVVLGVRLGWLRIQTLAVLAMSAIFALFVAQGGGRRTVGVMVGIALILWLLLQKKVGARGFVVVSLAVVGVLSFMQFMLEYRNVGFGAVGTEMVVIGTEGPRVLRVDDNFLRTAQTIRLIPDVYPYTGLKYFVYMAVRPIPRVLWPGKPVDSGFDLAAALGKQGVALSSSIVGESYSAGGFLALIGVGWFYGRLAVMGTQLLFVETHSAFLMYGAWLMALFAGFRSMIDLILFGYVVLAWVAVVWIARHFAPAKRTGVRGQRVPSARAPLVSREADSARGGTR